VRNSGIDLRDINTPKTNLSEIGDSTPAKQQAFLATRKKLSESNGIIKEIFSPEDLRSIIDTE
jgi:hypothetical protein